MESVAFDAFRRVGERIDAEWRAKGRSRASFAELCVRLLADSDLASSLSFESVMDAAILGGQLPKQADPLKEFAEPPITMFDGGDFVIDVNCWVGDTPSIHNHGFVGAFQVLHGQSVHTRFEFLPGEQRAPYFTLGDLRVTNSELLRVGDIREVLDGDRLIHTLVHVDAPSATIVVRTPPRHRGPEPKSLLFLRPGLACDGRFVDRREPLRRAMDCLEVYSRCERLDEYRKRVGALARQGTVDFAHAVLRKAQVHLWKHWNTFSQLLNDLSPRSDGLTPLLEAALQSEREHIRWAIRRAAVLDVDARFVCAILMHPTEATVAARLVKQYAGSRDIGPMLAKAVGVLSRSTYLGFRVEGPTELALTSVLLNEDETAMRRRLCERYIEADVTRLWPKLESVVQELRREVVVRDLKNIVHALPRAT